jgi:hypothetical protein
MTTDPGFTGRKNHGRGHTYYINGTKVDGVTTIIGNGLPKPALVNWAARCAADEAVDAVYPLIEAKARAAERERIRELAPPRILRRLAAQLAIDGLAHDSGRIYTLADLLDGDSGGPTT